MFAKLGGWLHRLIRSRAPQEEQTGHPVPKVDQRSNAPQAIQIGHVDTVTVLHGRHAHGHPPGEAELQQLQVAVLRLIETSGDRRGAIEAFMAREFGTPRITHLSRQQLWRVQRYCEKIEARRMGRRDGA